MVYLHVSACHTDGAVRFLTRLRFTKEMKDESAGLLAAAFIGIVPGYISRSVAGSYDNEAIAIFLLMFTFFCWIKALKIGSAFFGTLAALFYFYMVAAWGTSQRVRARKRGTSLTHHLRRRWLRFHHEHDPIALPRFDPDGQVQQPPLRRVFLVVRGGNACEYASPLRRFPAGAH